MNRIPRSDSLPDRPAPFFLTGNSRQTPPAAPASAKSPPSRYSNTLGLQELKTVCAAPPNTILHPCRTKPHPAALARPGVPALRKSSELAVLRLQQFR